MTATPKKGKSVADFRAIHDPSVAIPAKISAALKKMKDAKDSWNYEADVAQLAGITTAQLAMFREEFKEHLVEAPGTRSSRPRIVWFATPALAAEARGE